MSLLAKIFIVVVTVLSLVFLGVQATLFYHSNDWRLAYERLQQRMKVVVEEKIAETAAVQAQVKDLESKLGERSREFESAKAAAQKSSELYDQVTRQVADLKTQLDNTTNVLKTQTASVDEKDKSLAAQRAEIQRLTDAFHQAQGEKELAEAQVARVTSIKTALEKDIAEVRKDFTATKQKLLDAELVMDELQRIGVPISTLVINHEPLPPIRGKVAGVRADVQPALVLLTVGKDDKVKMGYPFTVYRGNEFIGKVVVEKVMADSAGCRVLFTAAGKAIKAGDEVATVLD
jgi:hypothetical protein